MCFYLLMYVLFGSREFPLCRHHGLWPPVLYSSCPLCTHVFTGESLPKTPPKPSCLFHHLLLPSPNSCLSPYFPSSWGHFTATTQVSTLKAFK